MDTRLLAQELTSKLIAIPSLSGQEVGVLGYLEREFDKLGWDFERIQVGPSNYNLFVAFGDTPKLVFSTHVDVVPAPKNLFVAETVDDRIIGRGACDAKGILACMIEACRKLSNSGLEDFALLILVEEETTGVGARIAASELKDRGIEWIVNGEPTEGKLMKAHKGALDFTVVIPGKSCHSGYPELGQDANRRMLEIADALQDIDFGSDPVLGAATLNLGVLQGGVGANVVSAHARIDGCIRTVSGHSDVIDKIRSVIPEDCKLDLGFNSPPAQLSVLPGFETDIASYCTDIPGLSELECEFFLIGPGSIHRAHTDYEWISKSEIESAVESYIKIAQSLIGN